MKRLWWLIKSLFWGLTFAGLGFWRKPELHTDDEEGYVPEHVIKVVFIPKRYVSFGKMKRKLRGALGGKYLRRVITNRYLIREIIPEAQRINGNWCEEYLKSTKSIDDVLLSIENYSEIRFPRIFLYVDNSESVEKLRDLEEIVYVSEVVDITNEVRRENGLKGAEKELNLKILPLMMKGKLPQACDWCGRTTKITHSGECKNCRFSFVNNYSDLRPLLETINDKHEAA